MRSHFCIKLLWALNSSGICLIQACSIENLGRKGWILWGSCLLDTLVIPSYGALINTLLSNLAHGQALRGSLVAFAPLTEHPLLAGCADYYWFVFPKKMGRNSLRLSEAGVTKYRFHWILNWYIFVMNRVISISSRKISAHLIATCEEKPLIPRVPFMVLENKVNAVMMTKIENFLCEFTVLHWPGLVLMKDLLTCIKVI